MEPPCQRLGLPKVELALARQDFGHHPLRSDFPQVGLRQAVFSHHELERIQSRRLAVPGEAFGFVAFDLVGQNIDQAG